MYWWTAGLPGCSALNFSGTTSKLAEYDLTMLWKRVLFCPLSLVVGVTIFSFWSGVFIWLERCLSMGFCPIFSLFLSLYSIALSHETLVLVLGEEIKLSFCSWCTVWLVSIPSGDSITDEFWLMLSRRDLECNSGSDMLLSGWLSASSMFIREELLLSSVVLIDVNACENESSLWLMLALHISGLEVYRTGLSGEAGATLGDKWNGIGALSLPLKVGDKDGGA